MQQNSFFFLEQVIDRNPLTVNPQVLLDEVMSLMHQWGNNRASDDGNISEVDNTHRTNSSCALVVENSQLQGIFTKRDLVKLVAADRSMAGATVGEVMSREMVTLTFTGTEDIFLALSLLRSHSIRHLPILKEDGSLLGLVTAKDIRQKLQPVNLMKWRKVREVMLREVVCASPDDTVRHLARLMAEHQVSCVAICETQVDSVTNKTLVHPLGIVTERDLIQFQNLSLDLEQPARNLMSAPLFLISPEDSLWSIHQQMQQRRVRRLLVGGTKGELLGIVTQTSLLEVLNPAEMYGIVEMLQRQVCQLETEREAFLHSRNRELEQEVKERTSVITTANQQLQRDRAKLRQAQVESEQQLEFERLIANISARFLTISAEQLSTEITSALRTISEFIQVETSYIFRFSEDGSTFSMIHEWSIPKAAPQIQNAQDLPVALFPWAIAKIERGETIYVNSVAELPAEAATDRESWQTFNLESLLIVPYRESKRIVGWLGFASFSQQIIWSPSKINLLQVVGEIFASTLQRQETSLALQASEQRLNSILSSMEDVVWSVDSQTFKVLYMNHAAEKVYGRSCADFYSNAHLWLEIVHPEDRERVSHFSQCLLEEGSHNIEYRIVRPDGEIRWLLDRAKVIYDELGTPIRFDGIASDITKRKQTELEIRKFVSLADKSSEFVGMCDLNFVPFYLNQAGKQLVGLDNLEQYREVLVEDFFFPEDRDFIFNEFFPQVLRQGQAEVEIRFRHFQTGVPIWMIYNVHSIEDENGRPIALATQSRDISDRKRAETKIRQQAALLDLTHDTVLVRDLENTITFWNQGAVEMYGWQTSEALGQNSHQLLKAHFSQPLSEIETTLFRHEYWSGEFIQQKKDGTEVIVLGRWSLVKDSNGNPQQILEINHDITERKRREEILKDIASGVSVETGENFLPSLCDYLCKTLKVDYAFVGELIQSEVDNIQTLAVHGRGRVIENFTYPMAGTPCQNVIQHEICIYPKAVRQHFPDDQMLQEMEAESYAGITIISSSRKGLGLIAIIDSKPFADNTLIEEVLKIFATRASTELERQQADEKIREQAALLDIANDAIMVCDLDDKILFWNQGAEKLYGWTATEVLERDLNELFYRRSTARLEEIQQTVLEQGEWQGELNHITKAGSEIVVESRWTLVKNKAGNPQSYLVVNTDITEQKQLETQFLRTQRLESLGTLAGGIAHDLNNILAPILGFSKLLPLKLPDVDEQTKGFFKIMESNANRGTALIEQILTFSRGMEGEKGIVQIRHLVNEIQQIISETFPKSIELEVSVPQNLWTVNADINQLHQVLMNLSVNARDAMPEGGKLKITAENFPIDRSFARLYLDAHEGSYLLITVSDTGVGIAPEIIERIFEPFFTTKELGRGTGLGLSTVIGIIKNHGGFVDVVSSKEPNARGTQFKIFLPALDTTTTEEEENAEIPQGNSELILVVDDETAILEVTKATLETYNYRVLTAENGIDAVALYAQNQQDIKAVIMDIMMPAMDGKTAIRILKKINPEVKIIAVSGLINRQEVIAELNEVTAFMNKPYTNDDLLRKIAEIIESESYSHSN